MKLVGVGGVDFVGCCGCGVVVLFVVGGCGGLGGVDGWLFIIVGGWFLMCWCICFKKVL